MKSINITVRGLLIFLAIIFSAASVQAYTASFTDGYWGGRTPTGYTDVVGSAADFDIAQLIYTTNNGHNTIQIIGNYFNPNASRLGTLLGDLFISTNGWHPNTTAANYLNDTMVTGEKWEIAVSLDKDDFSAKTGNLSLYALNSTNSDIDPTFYGTNNIDHFRSGQAYRHKNGISGFTNGTWTIDNNTLTLNFDYDFSRSQELGFHWGMSCGNDVIEGKVTNSVPEPGTMLLLGFGLVSLVGMGRLRKK